MNTFYRPGVVEMFLHGAFGRHSWFMDRFVPYDSGVERWSYKCRICLIDQPNVSEPLLINEL